MTLHDKIYEWIYNSKSISANGVAEAAKQSELFIVDAVVFAGVILVALLAYLITQRVVIRVTTKIVHHTKNTWDDEMLNSKLMLWLSMLVPTLIVWHLAPFALRDDNIGVEFGKIIQNLALLVIIALGLLSSNSILNIIERIYQRYKISRELPIKGFIQVIKILLFISGIIFMVSVSLNESPVIIFSGLGAMTAVLMLIFKDSILGLVAGVQLAGNRMVAKGDWIEMPKYGADGDVLEVALTTVKVRNFDKTITTVPTYALISDSFKNWRGMSQSGVRRIKRSINLDMNSVHFLNAEQTAEMKKITLLKEYIEAKEADIAKWNEDKATADNTLNARALTNIGTFRAYIQAYVRNHPKISNDETILIRQLQPSDKGLPIEIYIFTNDNRWVEYEGIQSDIFDHLISSAHLFKLRIFQSPSDYSMMAFANREIE
ncbi:mechanosensitive ion channel family protein [Persicirhabdus sediminis]|uniref:Mechanosensing system component YbdG n=1 Tax=Persicirhabdus sediminis TaxID=454144 RepID=A0A8J7MFN8_9BACT|nr:mechanosensitive ion channel family protein [Persicirhabdus sediminis]MBK1791902.1 mechanosensitive ion channel family protein [Persicirhabdus sediminis]